jgi:nucleotide-binding universal stress UspA family protein
LHLVNVQRPVSGDVASFIGSKSLEEYHRERADAELAPARALLDAAGVPYEPHRPVGVPGTTIAELATSLGSNLIVMGTRGQGASAAALLGSVAQSAIEHARVPVLLVK